MSYGGNNGGASMGKGTVGSAVDERVSQYMSNQRGGQSMGGGGMNSIGGGGGPGPGGGFGGEAGPSAQEIVDYARYIGMDPIGDVNLLWIAEEALCASLPEGWTEHTDQNGNTFYYNSTTGQSSWEHPLDEYYRSLFLKLKKILIDNRAAVKVNDSAVQLQCAIRSCYARRIFRRLLGKKRLDDAASDIQAVYRGHLVRLKVREESIKQWEELEKFSSTRLQATYRAHLVRRGIAKKREEWKREWRRRAATKLQATWRGHAGRRIAREEEMYQALELDEYAVTKLQSVYRGHLGRNKFRAKRKQLAIDKILLSAAKIQAVYRGHLARLEANAERELQMAEIEFEAALRVQAVMRGHWGRQLMRFRRRNFLAAKLQSVYRGHIARLDVMVLRRFNAANKLQAVYRGHVSRRFMVHHRQVVAIIRLHEWEQACALKLQSVYRGHIGRIGGFRLIRQTRSALRLQATYRGHLERARLRQSLAEEYAAVQIQRVYNGHIGRVAFRRLRTVLGAHKAALDVQRVLRGHWVRLELADRGARGAAALTLQRVYRGHLSRAYGGEDPFADMATGGRKRVAGGGGPKAARHAALTLQRVYRGHLDRLVVQEIIKKLLLDMQAMSADAEAEEEAVLTLQLAFKCRYARHEMRALQARRTAAVCVQCAYRSKGARVVYQALVGEKQRVLAEEEARRLEEERLAAPSPAGSAVSRASRSSQVSRGSKAEQKEGVAADEAGERSFFMHPLEPMQGDPTATPGLDPEVRAASRRSQRSRPGTQASEFGEAAARSAPGTVAAAETLTVPDTAGVPGTAASERSEGGGAGPSASAGARGTIAISAGAIQEGATVEAPGFTRAQDDLVSAGGEDSSVKWLVALGVNDFDMSTTFKVGSVDSTEVAFNLWAGEDHHRIGLDGAEKVLFRSGHSWGSDAVLDSGLDKTPLQDNCTHTLRLVRTGGRLAVFLDSVPIPGWQSLELESAVTAAGWLPKRASLHIQTLELLPAGAPAGVSSAAPGGAGSAPPVSAPSDTVAAPAGSAAASQTASAPHTAEAPGSAAAAPSVAAPGSAPGSAARPVSQGEPPALSVPVPGTAQSDVLEIDDGGELEPLVDVAGGETALSGIISGVLTEAVRVVGSDIEKSDFPAPTPPRSADTFDADLLPTSRSRPQTRGSVSGSRLSGSSVGTEQAREELAGIGGAVGEMVDGVFSQIAGGFPDSVPSSRPGTASALSSMSNMLEPDEIIGQDMLESGSATPESQAANQMPATPGVATTTPQPATPAESQPQTPAGSAPPTPGPVAPQTSLIEGDSEVADTQEGQYGSRPSTAGGGGGGIMADAPPAKTAEELAAEEERLAREKAAAEEEAREREERAAEERRQEAEMLRQVNEMREELARVYERDLVTFFDLYLALSQPV